ncbi:cupin domain-containing protein [Brevibacillus fluminis]|uniref:cupin domain-containing protein n=1 Tax=Brevibacillus fluminis TaxID=511487 RepID=UPI003F89B7D9
MTKVISPKARVPLTGEGVLEQDEYFYIIRGSIQTGSGGKEYTVSAGEATLIPAGEQHWAYNDGKKTARSSGCSSTGDAAWCSRRRAVAIE